MLYSRHHPPSLQQLKPIICTICRQLLYSTVVRLVTNSKQTSVIVLLIEV